MPQTQPDGGPKFGSGALLMILGAGAQALSYWTPNLGSRFYVTWVLMAAGLVMMTRAAVAKIRQGSTAGGIVPLVAITAVCACVVLGAYTVASPSLNAEQAVDQGESAARQLKDIIEPHLDLIEAATEGPELLASWKKASAQAIPLKPQFAAAVEASKLLAARSEGDQKRHHELDAQYFGLCAEWVDLYQEVHDTFQNESIDEAPPEWGLRLNQIVLKIQSLPPDPLAGP